MKRKTTIKILIISLMMILVCCPTAYCTATGTVRMKIDNSTPWTNINVSESYEECMSLNSTSSTLGTSALKAHLTTEYDWSIMAVFSVSQYGSVPSNKPADYYGVSTNSNKSGVYDIGLNCSQTTGLLYTSKSGSTLISGLYDESGNPKKYVDKINPTTGEDQNGYICISYLYDGGTRNWLGARSAGGSNVNFPVSLKQGLFDVFIGNTATNIAQGDGAGTSKTTFRPVIWNQ